MIMTVIWTNMTKWIVIGKTLKMNIVNYMIKKMLLTLLLQVEIPMMKKDVML